MRRRATTVTKVRSVQKVKITATEVFERYHPLTFSKIILAFLSSLTLAYLSISLMSVMVETHRMTEGLMTRAECKVLGLAVQFTFLHAFFWMNVLCFDIYRKFTR